MHSYRILLLLVGVSACLPVGASVALAGVAEAVWALGVSRDSGWHDVNKAFYPRSQTDIDALGPGALSDYSLCWAAQSSNMLQYWQDAYTSAGYTIASGTPDGRVPERENSVRRQYEIFEYFVNNWTNKGGYGHYAIPWYMTGEFYREAPGSNIAQVKADATGTGGFFTDIYSSASALCGNNFDGDFQKTTYADYAAFSAFLINAFSKRNAVVGLEFFYVSTSGALSGAHAVTAWGCEFDEYGFVTKVYLTDSDDGVEKLVESNITVEDSRVYLDATIGGYKNRVTNLTSLSVSKLLAIPEPSVFGLLAGIVALAFAGTRRRRH